MNSTYQTVWVTLLQPELLPFGHLYNGHKASVVKIESFIPYFNTDRYVIDHHSGDVYLWDRESNNTEPLALQTGTTPLSADAAKMLAQTVANAC